MNVQSSLETTSRLRKAQNRFQPSTDKSSWSISDTIQFVLAVVQCSVRVVTQQYSFKRISGSKVPRSGPGFRFVVSLKRISGLILRGACDDMLLPVKSTFGLKFLSALTGCRSISTKSASPNGGLHVLNIQ